MADTAAHLVDRVFPEVPIRQWVLSLPFALRYRLAYDARLVTEVLHIFVQAVFGSLRRRAGFATSNRKIRCGAVSFVQRFGDALNLNVHFHTLALDGIYIEDETGCIRFRQAAPPSDAEVARVTERIQHQITRLLERRGLGPQADADESDALQNSQPLLAELYGASVCGRVATGPRAGRKIAKVGDAVDLEDIAVPSGPRCAAIAGYSVHANVCIPAHDRMRLERLCRYAGRPPVATERLSLLPDGRLLYRLKHRWRDGTTHMIFEPLELVEKLAALVPPPRFNLVRYHGVLAPSAAWRPLVIPSEPEPEIAAPSSHPACPAKEQVLSETKNLQTKPSPEITDLVSHPSGFAKKQIPENLQKKSTCRPRNYSWAELMRRIFSIDVLVCPRCGGRMRILCAIHPPEAIHKILECLGLPSRPPPIARALPEHEIEGFEFL